MSDIDDELFALAGGDEDADVEEGEASSVAASSPNSLGSDAMDESDSDREDSEASPAKDGGSLYPLEGKYIDAKDRIRILALSEVEREEIIGQRMEEITKANFKSELARRLQASNADKSSGDRKRKAGSQDYEDSQRKSGRRVKAKTNEPLEAYKSAREQKNRRRLNDQRTARRRSRSSTVSSRADTDADGESEPEWDRGEKAPKKKIVDRALEEPAELMHFEALRVGRGLFSKVCFYPKFEEIMVGTYVRVGTGLDAQKRTIYKMAQIKGFTTGKPYVFEGKENHRIGTDQYVITQHGSVKKEYNFTFLSNQRFTPSDFEAYKQALAEANLRIPTQGTLKRIYDEMKKFENRFWTDVEITERIRRENQYYHLVWAKIEDTRVEKPPSKFELESRRIAQLNKENRRLDSERVRKALIAERKQAQREKKEREREYYKKIADEEAKKKAEEEKAAKKAEDDLFGSDSKTGTPRSGTPKPEKKKRELKGIPTFRRPKMEDEIIAAMDIGFDIEV